MKPFTPFSDNILFVDTEFTSLDPYKGELLSIGLVKPNGEELYIELEWDGAVDDWVQEHVVPFLAEEKIERGEAIRKLKDFVGNKEPFMVAYVNQFDALYLYKLCGTDGTPFHWIPIDFASVLFSLGMSPESYYHGDKNNFYQELGIDHTRYREHHALDDAKLLREVYLKLASKQA